MIKIMFRVGNMVVGGMVFMVLVIIVSLVMVAQP